MLFDTAIVLENICIFASVIRVRVSMSLQFLDSDLSQGLFFFFFLDILQFKNPREGDLLQGMTFPFDLV